MRNLALQPQGADDCLFTNVSTEVEFGQKVKTLSSVPMMTGALGTTFVTAKYWDAFAVGAALVGFPIVIGENVVGVDRAAGFKNGTIEKSLRAGRRINTDLRYFDGNGGAEYVMDKFGDRVSSASAARFRATTLMMHSFLPAASNRETEQELGIPFMTEALGRSAKRILSR